MKELKEVKEQLTNVRGQLRDKELQAAALHEQLRERELQENNSQRKLRQTEQQLEGSQRLVREWEQQLAHFQSQLGQQLREKEQQKENSLVRLREMEKQLQKEKGHVIILERQLRDRDQDLVVKEQQEENSLVRLREMEQQLQKEKRQVINLERQLRDRDQNLVEKEQQEENSLVRLRRMEQQLQKEKGQVINLERQLRDRYQDLVKLKKTLSEADKKLKEYQHQETHDWIIPRDEIIITNKQLGRGGWGYVMEGKYCGCAVAVKKLFEEVAFSPYNQRKFEREMDIASKCRHPCLLQFIGATNDKESPLLVTELMESSLRELWTKRPLSETEVLTISLDVARALNYLHHKKPKPILHRDVSSANVLLWRRNDQWRAKVSDYGTANFLQDTMTAGAGAMMYSACEAFTRDRQTVKVSFYSAYFLFTHTVEFYSYNGTCPEGDVPNEVNSKTIKHSVVKKVILKIFTSF